MIGIDLVIDYFYVFQEIDDGDVKDEAEEAENDAETGSGGGRGYWQNIYGFVFVFLFLFGKSVFFSCSSFGFSGSSLLIFSPISFLPFSQELLGPELPLILLGLH